VASASDGFIRQLRKRGYRVPEQVNGNGHREIWFGETLVATTSGSRGDGGRGFANFKSQIRRFEESKPTRKTRVRRARS
jgi:hypothetical protein